jgi:outer membrane receptor for ferrienterochelin and colicin
MPNGLFRVDLFPFEERLGRCFFFYRLEDPFTVRTLALLVAAFLGFGVLPAGAAPASGSATGSVTSPEGSPVAGAAITLAGNGPARTATSDAHGTFAFATLVPGTYTLRATAHGYATLSGKSIQILANEVTTLQLTMQREQATSLTVIGNVRANGGTVLSTASAPVVQISAPAYAAQAVPAVSDILQNEMSTTVVPVLGGGLNAPEVVALRGPDPSETLVDVDGHQINNGNTGDFDLSLLDPAELQSIEVVYGIAPSTLFGPNTLGGALNVRTLEPTTTPQTLERFSAGSYNSFMQTLQATGTEGRWGYAFSLHRYTSGGQLDDYDFPYLNDKGTKIAGYAPIGNDMWASSAIAKLRYSFANGGFIGVTFRDQAVNRDLSAVLSAGPPPGGPIADYENFSGTSASSTNLAYDLDLQLPLGNSSPTKAAPVTMTFRHQTAVVNQSVNGPGTATSPYLYNDRDLSTDDTLEFDRPYTNGSLSLKFALTNETLAVNDYIPGVIYADVVQAPSQTVGTEAFAEPADASASNGTTVQQLGQTQRWVGARYEIDPTAKLHYQFGAYYSDFSSFGHSVDPRFGFVWTPTADTALRTSVGSTFQSPQLPTFIVPSPLPPPAPTGEGNYVSIGNRDATAERSTEYDLGLEHFFRIPKHQIHVSFDLYRTDLHNGVATYFSGTPCTPPYGKYDGKYPCLSYPVNVTQEVYQGFALNSEVALAQKTSLHLDYDADSVYTQSVPQNSLDGVILNEQALGVPLHKLNLTIEHDPNAGLSYYAGMLYEGNYNELNLPPFATLRAGITWHLRGLDVGVYGENLTNAYDFLTTQANGGVPYGAYNNVGKNLVLGTTPTDALPLAGRQIRVVITRRT